MEDRIAELEQALEDSEKAARDAYNMLVKVYKDIGSLTLPMGASEKIMPIYREMQEFLKEEE